MALYLPPVHSLTIYFFHHMTMNSPYNNTSAKSIALHEEWPTKSQQKKCCSPVLAFLNVHHDNTIGSTATTQLKLAFPNVYHQNTIGSSQRSSSPQTHLPRTLHLVQRPICPMLQNRQTPSSCYTKMIKLT